MPATRSSRARRRRRRHRGVDRRRHHLLRGRRRPLDGWTVPVHPTGSPGNENDWTVGDAGRPAAHRRGTIAAGDVRPPAGDHRLPRRSTSASTRSRRRRRHRRRPPGPRLRAGEPDPTDLRHRMVHRLDHRRGRRRARAGPPVVRRQPAPRAVAGHLAQRGFRHLRRVAVERARRPGDGPGALRLLHAVIPADDPFWTVIIGDPGPDLLFDIAVYYRAR